MMPESLTGNAVTVIIGETVRSGCEDAFRSWQHEMNSAAAKYPGFIAAEIDPPTSMQPQWTVIYRFDTVPNLRAWLNSATRHDRLRDRRSYCNGPATQQILTGAAAPADTLVTVEVTHRVPPEHVDDFLRWQQRLRLAEKKFPGYRGSEMFRPIHGVQDEWTTLYRYDSAADLDRWLTSPQRQQLLREGKRFNDFRLHTIDNSFGSWFAFNDDDSGHPRTPSNAKTAIAIWFGVYPTVMVISLALAPTALPMWLGLLIGNLLSSIVMTYIMMPFVVNPLLKHWLYPAPNTPKTATNIRATLVIATVMVFWAVLFWLLTTVFWKLG